ncbi:hypothetical protein ACTMTI_40675 [Nonomuraea sp. H19]|uniref:hypothetical protein n=1 Tax=Nonomuraea sp. H19 TaxID=3452206 RepID=UPI003F8CEE6E
MIQEPGPALEIACDESGAEGEKLVGGNTDVFAHASVLMDTVAAEDCIRELRARAPSPVTQYKAIHILREKHRAALRWLLGPSGPVLGHVHVHLTDKTFLVIGKVIGLLAEDAARRPHPAAGDAFPQAASGSSPALAADPATGCWPTRTPSRRSTRSSRPSCTPSATGAATAAASS